MKNKTGHTTFRNKKLFCLNCGGEFSISYPIPIEVMTKKIEAFNVLHKDCEKTWTEPVADQSKYPENMDVFVAERKTEFAFGLVNGIYKREINFMEEPDGEVLSRDYVIVIDEE
jgi:hypothetical protein